MALFYLAVNYVLDPINPVGYWQDDTDNVYAGDSLVEKAALKDKANFLVDTVHDQVEKAAIQEGYRNCNSDNNFI